MLTSRNLWILSLLSVVLVSPWGNSQDQAASASQPQLTQQQQDIARTINTNTGTIAARIQNGCKYNADETNPKKIRRTNDCISKTLRIYQQNIRLQQALENTAQAQAILEERARSGPAAASVVASLNAQQSGNQNPPVSSSNANGAAEAFVGNSLTGTPSTCGTASTINNAALIRVHRVVMTPQIAADDFGYRLGRRFVVYQVTVENGNKDFQFMLQDVSVDFSRQFNQPPGTYSYSASAQDLSLLRGVPEKGQDLDPRNVVLHVLQGIGSVAGAVSGLTSFADVMGPSVAVFNGSFLQGYTAISPDHSGAQLNRLSDSAFSTNTVIDKQRAKTIAMFVPADEVLSHADQKDFRKDPNAFLGFAAQTGILLAADVCVDGSFIQAVTAAAPTLSTAVLAKSPTPAPSVDSVLTVTGSNLIAGDTEVVVGSGANAAIAPIVTTDGKTGTAQVHLPADYATGTTTAMLRSKANQSLTSGQGIKITVAQ